MEKLKTLTLKEEEEEEEEEEETTLISFPFPNEIIQDILSRLPIKPILQFKSVSKQWLSLISHGPCFPKLHMARSLAALFMTAYDQSTRLRHLLSAPLSGGHVTHLMTLNNAPSTQGGITELEAEHLRGLVLLTSGNGFLEDNNHHNNIPFAFIINPSTRNIYKLPDPPASFYMCYFFGFDEFTNEHKVLNLRIKSPNSLRSRRPRVFEFMIFSLSDYSWRKIDVGNFPVDSVTFCFGTKSSVCVNSVIHVMLQKHTEILAFDLRTEKFDIIKVPDEASTFETATRYNNREGRITLKFNHPVVMKVHGLLGVLCHDRVLESNEMYVWVLDDYENRVWVRKTIAFPGPWLDLDGPFPSGAGNAEEILFYPKRLSRNVMTVPMYDLKTGSFKSVKYFLGHQFLRSKTVKFNDVTSYIESIVPLEMNDSGTS